MQFSGFIPLLVSFAAALPLHAGPFGPVTPLAEVVATPSWRNQASPVTALSVFPANGRGSGLLILSHAGDLVSRIDSIEEPLTPVSVTEELKGPCAACVIDANGDPDLDLVVASRWSRELILWTADGSGGFNSGVTIATGLDAAVALQAVDLDGDGLDDLVGATDHDRSLFWLRRLPAGGFASAEVLAELPAPADRLLAGRIDTGTTYDLVVLAGGAVHVFLNDGTPELTSRAIWGAGLDSFALADLDGGSLDIVAASTTLGICIAGSGDGAGDFSAPGVLAADLDAPELLGIRDLDGDVLPDLCLLSRRTGSVDWMRGRGNLVFDPPSNARELGEGAGPVILTDLNGDQAPELTHGSVPGESLFVSFGLGTDPYAFWCDDQGLDPASHPPEGDANQDGIANGIAFASNLTADQPTFPLVPGSGTAGLPVAWTDPADGFSFEFVRRTHPSGPSYVLLEGSDLTDWAPADLGTAAIAPIDADWERVRYSPPPAPDGRLFLRLQVDFPAP